MQSFFFIIHSCPPRSPELTPCDLFLWGCVKDGVFIPPLLTSFPELKQEIYGVLQTINSEYYMLQKMAHCINIMQMIKYSHIEHGKCLSTLAY